ncbi:MAG: hypothetical protein C5B55_11175 [Blastocatellia bacterium]|nr:MAG: hypothetical protein C5B55_11175 [Blastocatellia bacterium]
MSELVAFVFRDEFRAPEVLNELRRRDWPWVRDLDEAVAVTLNEDGKARVHLSIDLSTYKGSGWARLWGSLLGTMLFLPLSEVMVQVADGIAFSPNNGKAITRNTNGSTPESEWWTKSLENSGNFKRDVAALMVANGSAIFMLLRSHNAAPALKQLGNYGNTIVHTSLSAEQDEKLCALLAFCREGRS